MNNSAGCVYVQTRGEIINNHKTNNFFPSLFAKKLMTDYRGNTSTKLSNCKLRKHTQGKSIQEFVFLHINEVTTSHEISTKAR